MIKNRQKLTGKQKHPLLSRKEDLPYKVRGMGASVGINQTSLSFDSFSFILFCCHGCDINHSNIELNTFITPKKFQCACVLDCHSLYMNCPPQTHVFEQLVPRWQHCGNCGRFWTTSLASRLHRTTGTSLMTYSPALASSQAPCFLILPKCDR